MKKLIVFLCIFLTIGLLCISSYAKYVIENTSLVANINIDGEIPKIEFLSVKNSNEKYNKYANKTHTITIELRVKERNIKKDNTKANIKFLLDDTEFRPRTWELSRRKSGEYVYYKITLYEISGNGKLIIKIPNGSVIDTVDQVNEEAVLDTGIIIDNIAPAVNFFQEQIEDGKINAKIKANEKIREVNAWNLSEEETLLSKEFACNVLYPFKVTDFAGNSSVIDVKIDKATNIKIRYGATAGNWEFGTGLNEIAGKKAIEQNKILKTEAISFYWEGLDKDFIQARNYVYTYWGEGIQGRCYTYEVSYNSGYNPGKDEYATLANGNIINLDGNLTLLLGGRGVNRPGNSGYGGKAIPEEIASQYPFGISALSIKLKDESYYSVVYQVWVNGKGWLEPVSDGEETTLSHDKPIGAYRMSLIPKTEKQYLIDLWQKDVGTNNMK